MKNIFTELKKNLSLLEKKIILKKNAVTKIVIMNTLIGPKVQDELELSISANWLRLNNNILSQKSQWKFTKKLEYIYKIIKKN